MEHAGIRRSILVPIAAFIFLGTSANSEFASVDLPNGPVVPDEDLLPDGRPLPDLPVTVSGAGSEDGSARHRLGRRGWP